MTCCGNHSAQAKKKAWGVTRIVGALFFTGNCMLASLVVNISELTYTERRVLHLLLLLLTGSVALLCGPRFSPILLVRQWRQGRGRVEALFGLGMLGATTQSLYSVWVGGGPVYFEVVCVLLLVYRAANETKSRSQLHVQAALTEALPPTQQLRRICAANGATAMAPVSDIAVGDHILVHAGEDILADGTVMEGVAFVHEALLSGESFCVTRSPSDSVHAGTRVLDGPLRIRVDATVGHRHIDRLCEAIVRGLGAQSHVEVLVDRVAAWLLGGVISVAVVTGAAWYVFGGAIAPALLNAMSVLLVACPCALGFATPVGLYTAVIRMARLGIVSRSTAAIERLAQVDTVVFDKTGTLTAMHLRVTDIAVAASSPWPRDDIIAMTLVAQSMSHHPVAAAFASLASRSASRHYQPKALRVLPGRGIQAMVHDVEMGTDVQVEVVALDEGSISEEMLVAQTLAMWPCGLRRIGIFIDRQLVAVAGVAETPIEGGRGMLERLHADGLECTVLTGDSPARLQPWFPSASQGGLGAHDKAAYVRQLREQGRHVCFVGDGINDAPAMAGSHTSIALSMGAPLTIAASDITLSHAALSHLPRAIQVARETMRLVRSNLYIAAGYNVAGVAVAAAGLLHPVFAAGMMLCASLTVTLRSARLLQHTP